MLGLAISLSLAGQQQAGGGSPPAVIPVNTVAPTLTDAQEDGATQTLDYGTWTDADTLSIAYKVDGTTVQTYAIDYGDPAPTRAYDYDTEAGKFRWIEVTATNTASGQTATEDSPVRVGQPDFAVGSGWIGATDGTALIDLAVDPTFQILQDSDGTPYTTAPYDKAAKVYDDAAKLTTWYSSSRTIVREFDGAIESFKFKVPLDDLAALDIPAGQLAANIHLCWTSAAGQDAYWKTSGVRLQLMKAPDGWNAFLSALVNGADVLGSTLLHSTSVFEETWDNSTEFEIRREAAGKDVYYDVYVDGIRITANYSSDPLRKGPVNSSNAKLFDNQNVCAIGPIWQAGSFATPEPFLISADWEVLPADYVTVSLGTVVQSPDDPGKIRVPVSGDASGGVANVQLAVLLTDGGLVANWTAPIALGGGVYSTHLDLPLIDGQAFVVYARSASDPTISNSAEGDALILPVIEPMQLGINEDYATYWDVSTVEANLFKRGTIEDTAGKSIGFRNAALSGDVHPSSADGLDGTVKMDMDGRVYGNSLGLASYRFSMAWYLPATGIYDITFPAGTAVTLNSAPPGNDFTYNEATGKGSITFNSWDLSSHPLRLGAAVDANIEANGIFPDIRLRGVEGDLQPEAVASAVALSTIWRPMVPSGVSWFDLPLKRTSTALPVLTLAERWTGGRDGPMSLETMVGFANAAGQHFYHNSFYFADSEYLEWEASYIATNLAAGKTTYIEVSNEPWNFQIPNNDARLEGCRRGYATTPVGSPQTIIDATYTMVSGETATTTVDFSEDDLLYVHVWGGGVSPGYQVFRCKADAPSGTGLSNSAYFELHYDTTQTAIAQKRMWAKWLTSTKTAMQPAFDSANRAVKYCLNHMAVNGFPQIKETFDFEDSGQHIDYLMGGWYVGGGVAGPDVGVFANGIAGVYTETDKAKIYAGDMAGALTAYFAGMYNLVDQTIEKAKVELQDLTNYNVSKGRAKNHTKIGAYEGGFHEALNGWPDMCGVWTSRGYDLKEFVIGSDGKTYRCILKHTAGQDPISSPTYWSEYWSAAQTGSFRSPGRKSREFFLAAHRDERMYDLVTYFLGRWRDEVGGPFIWYTRAKIPGSNPTDPNTAVNNFLDFGVQHNEQDTDTVGIDTNWQYKALMDFQAGLAA